MWMIKLTGPDIKYITLFEKLTGATVKDCIVSNDNKDLTFIVKEGDMGLAIGRSGRTIDKIKKRMKREIHIYEHSKNPKKFLKNLFYPIEIEKVEVNMKEKEAKVYIDPGQRKRAIGRGGKKIKTVKEIAKRHLGIEDIQIV